MQEWSQEEIEQLFNEHKSGLIYLYTPLCGTCQLASKMLTVIEELMPEQLIGKADLNFMPAFAGVLGVESVPCLIVVKDGNIQEKIYAFHSVPYLLDRIKSAL